MKQSEGAKIGENVIKQRKVRIIALDYAHRDQNKKTGAHGCVLLFEIKLN